MKWRGRFEGYHRGAFRQDLVAGLIVGIIAIPLGMAFAIASGVKPEYGIYTVVIGGFLISLFGGSRFQIGGPTGAFIPVLFVIVMEHGYENLLIAGFMAGILLLVMGLTKLGSLIKFIPRSVTVGFTAGIAVIIFSTQIPDFLGIANMKKQDSFLLNMREIALHLSEVNAWSIITAVICLVVILLTNRFLPKIPSSLMGLIVSSVIATIFFAGKIPTIGSTFGDIPSSIPGFQFPELTWDRIVTLAMPALIIALLGGIESLLSAVVADGMTKTRHDSNRELVGQGIANMVIPLFGGIPATGAIARTATNIRSGAVSPISGMVHAAVVLLILLVFAPYASYIPLASIAPILMVVAWNMSGRKEVLHVVRSKTNDSFVLIVTFLLTVLTNITIAVQVGLVLAFVLFVKKMSDMFSVVKVLPDENEKNEKLTSLYVLEGRDCPQVSIYTIQGPLFFGAARSFENAIGKLIDSPSMMLLLKMGNVPYIDASGEDVFASLTRQFIDKGGTVLISEMQEQPLEMLKKTGLYEEIGAQHFFEKTGDAIDYAVTLMDKDICMECRQFAFRECDQLSHVQPKRKIRLADPIHGTLRQQQIR